VINQLIEAVLAKDRDFIQWRTEHPTERPTTPAPRRESDARVTAAEPRN
jgi:hypothetical protein